METYLKEWLDVLDGMMNDNTYKLAWGRSIIECVMMKDYDDKEMYVEIDFERIAKRVLKYYWNQTFFFRLKQGPNTQKLPIVQQITESVIDNYVHFTGLNYPVWYDKAIAIIHRDEKEYHQIIKRLSNALRADVCWRFMNANNKTYNLYQLNKKEGWIRVAKENVRVLRDYGYVLTQLLNYKWAQLLEQFNRSPKIVSKVKGSQENKIRRTNLAKFKEILLGTFPDGLPIDFYTGEPLLEPDITVDHVIPWSFLYSDDIWNLVLTKRSINSAKSNSIPTLEQIEKLKERNRWWMHREGVEKIRMELVESEENRFIDRYYMDLKA